jgi:acyl transferase domain-containing protein
MDAFAIVGFAFKMPGEAIDEGGLWEILANARNLSTDWPKGRLNVDSFKDQGLYARGAHFMEEDPALFDAAFFSMTAKEAAAMDPQQRIGLEMAYLAFENAGIPIESMRESKTAVFAASMADDYSRIVLKDLDTAPVQAVTGLQTSIIANRLSWFFDFHGPSVYVDTACSSSMVALDMACQTIRSGNASAALVLGSNVLLSPESSLLLGKGGFISPDSKCFSFDSRANGYARGEGVVALLIKPMQQALQNGDMIRAVIRGSASNQDGRTPTLTYPGAAAQESLIRHVYESAGLRLDKTRYVEAHGTGTKVGDPIEATAIGRVFGQHRSADEPLFIGSIKSNLGHMEAASGGAGIIKTIMVLEKGVIPPVALFKTLNPEINASALNLEVATRCLDWPSEGLRRASISSFGFGGTNSHVILDDAFHYLQEHRLDGFHNCTIRSQLEDNLQAQHLSGSREHATPNGHRTTNGHAESNGQVNGRRESEMQPKLLVWSAADAASLQRMLDLYQSYIKVGIKGPSFGDQLAYTLAARRSLMSWRTFAVIDAQQVLSAGTAEDESKLLMSPPVRVSASTTAIALAFTGQGAQYAGMGKELLRYPVFKQSLQRSDDFLAKFGCTWSVFDELSGENDLQLPEYSQPLCTVLQIALIELLRHFHVAFAAVVGHSSGEIAAAYAAGALSHQSACKVAFFRGQLAGRLRTEAAIPGAMLAVSIAASDLPKHMETFSVESDKHHVHVACFNSPTNVTLSGPSTAIHDLADYFNQHGIFAQVLRVGVAYHSPAMQCMAKEYLDALGTLHANLPTNDGVPMISSVTGQLVSPKALVKPQYWVDNLVSPVRFVEALERLTADLVLPSGPLKVTDILEVGPHPALRRPIKDSVSPSLRYHSILTRKLSPLKTTLELLGTLFCLGYPVSIIGGNSQTFAASPFLVDAPAYPFDHSRRYWSESRLSKDYRLRKDSRGYLLGKRAHDWNVLRPEWRNWLCIETMPWLADHVVSALSVSIFSPLH